MSKIIKILIVNTYYLNNKGTMGRLEGMISCLEKGIPNAKIVVLHRCYATEKEIVKQLVERHPNIMVRPHPWFVEHSSMLATGVLSIIGFLSSTFCIVLRDFFHKLGIVSKNKYQQYDIVIDLNFIEPESNRVGTFGTFFILIDALYMMMLAKKPLIVCSATIGPYKTKFIRWLTKYVLNRVDMITLREKETQNYLQELGVNKPPIYLTADLAFLFESQENSGKIVGILNSINVSHNDMPIVGIIPIMVGDPAIPVPYMPHYFENMAKITDFIIETLNATAIYIIHADVDKPSFKKIHQQVNNKNKVRVLPDTILASETKGIIGMCDVVISWKMHPLVASTTSCVPSIGIVAYSKHKFHGIIGEMMGQEDYLLDVDGDFDDVLLAELESKIKDIWIHRESIAKDLKERKKVLEDQASFNCDLIKKLIE